jgi:hypothetical protein
MAERGDRCTAKMMRFEVLSAVSIMITVVWDVTPCRLVDIHRSVD